MIGKPRTKDESELAWAKIKRAVTSRVNYEAQLFRERELNARLAAEWATFDANLKKDKIIEPADDELDDLETA